MPICLPVNENDMKIEKKVIQQYFDKLCSGEKTFELRLADWECKSGDTLILREWNAEIKSYTGRQLEKEVSYVLKTKDLNLFSKGDIEKFGYQIISFGKIPDLKQYCGTIVAESLEDDRVLNLFKVQNMRKIGRAHV